MVQGLSHSKKSYNIFDKVDFFISKLEQFIMAIGVIMMAVNTIANVISRFVFNYSLSFSEELNSIFILLVTFAGIGYAARHGRHIRMSAIYDALPQHYRKFMMVLITFITGIVMLFLAWYAMQYIINLHEKGRIYPALGIPIYVTYLWVPVGFLVTGIQYLLTFRKNLKEKQIYISTDLREEDAQEVEV